MVGRALDLESADWFLTQMLELSQRVTVNFLENPALSPAVALDPIGSRNQQLVKELRRRGGKKLAPRSPGLLFPVDSTLLTLPGQHGSFLDGEE